MTLTVMRIGHFQYQKPQMYVYMLKRESARLRIVAVCLNRISMGGTMTVTNLIERCAAAAREKIVRQYCDDERGHCPAGSAFYEEHIAPSQIARAVIAEFLAALREPAMLDRRAGWLDWADDERVRAAERETAERVIRALVCEISDAPG